MQSNGDADVAVIVDAGLRRVHSTPGSVSPNFPQGEEVSPVRSIRIGYESASCARRLIVGPSLRTERVTWRVP